MRLTRILTLFLAATTFMTTGARAQYSSVPSFLRVTGTQNGVPDPTGSYTVTVRDFANNPVVDAAVRLDFNNCIELALCSLQGAGVQLDCAAKSVTGTTNASGQVVLRVVGAGNVSGSTIPPAIAAGAGSGCIRVYANEIQLGTSTAILFDLNGTLPAGNGVSPLDLSIAKNDVGAVGLGAPYRGRSDFSQDNGLTPVDLSFMRTIVGLAGLGQGSLSGCATAAGPASYCP